MNPAIYYPILRAKSGEISAVAALTPRVRRFIRPVFDVPTRGGAITNYEYLATVVVDIARSWGTSLPTYLDLSRHDPDTETADGQPLISRLFENARQAHLCAIPVAGPVMDKHGKSGAYLNSIADIAARDGRGAAIRIPFPDLTAPYELSGLINEVQNAIALDDSKCDVFLDAGPTDSLPGGLSSAESVLSGAFTAAVHALGQRRFRAVIVCASSIPKSAKSSNPDMPFQIENFEYRVWSQLLNSISYRHVRFGDYGARFANQTDNKTFARPPARIHLSTPNRHTLYVDGRISYRKLAKRALEAPELASQIGIWGKDAIRDAACGASSEGSATDWVARDTHMHLETMARAVADRILEVSGALPEEEPTKSFPHDQAKLPL